MFRSVLFLVGLCVASGASAVGEGASPTGFKVTHEVTVAASPATVWRALGRVGRWWDPEHTWSGEARNMRIVLAAGECFCERWQGNSVEHARVVWAQRDQRPAE